MDLKALKDLKRITVFAGHYGSGKTNIAVNFALAMRKLGKDHVAIADLDIVNPYFRTKDAADVLEENSIRMISSPYANTNVDTPALPSEAYAIVHDKTINAVIDVGGDDRGALALGRYTPYILEENNYEMLFVINRHRYLTHTPEDAVEVMREIEDAAGMRFTGIVNNSNLGDETNAECVLAGLPYAEEVSRLSGLPVRFHAVRHDLCESVGDKIDNILPLKLYVRQTFKSN